MALNMEQFLQRPPCLVPIDRISGSTFVKLVVLVLDVNSYEACVIEAQSDKVLCFLSAQS